MRPQPTTDTPGTLYQQHAADQDASLARVVMEFGRARDITRDRDWAERAKFALMADDVAESEAVAALTEALQALTDAQEDPHTLFGEPEIWAASVRADAVNEGRLLATVRRQRGALIVSRAAGYAAVGAGLVAIGGIPPRALTFPMSLWLFALPFLMSLTVLLLAWCWDATARRRGRRAAHALTWPLAAALIAAIVIAVAFVDLGAPELHRAWLLAPIPVWLVVWFLAAFLAPAADDADPAFREDLPDTVWSAQLRGVLIADVGLSTSRVRTILDEAHAHARASGSGLAEEFGTPATYAARYQRRGVVKAGELPLVMTSMALTFAMVVITVLTTPAMTRSVAETTANSPTMPALILSAFAAIGWITYSAGRGEGRATPAAEGTSLPDDADPPALGRREIAGQVALASPWALPALGLALTAGMTLFSAGISAIDGEMMIPLTPLRAGFPVLFALGMVIGVVVGSLLWRVTTGWGALAGGVVAGVAPIGVVAWLVDDVLTIPASEGHVPVVHVAWWAAVGLVLAVLALLLHRGLAGRAAAWHRAAPPAPDRREVARRWRSPILQTVIGALITGVFVAPVLAGEEPWNYTTWVFIGLGALVVITGWVSWALARRAEPVSP
ncbi:MAG: hypothetical protein Q4G34_01410 [Micrococcus sp.]|nr:hypothetical protein [Micrococcus sp.]